MDNDEKRLRVEYLIAHKNNLWMGVVILTGGLTSILLTINYSETLISGENIIKIFLFCLGFFLASLMAIGLMNIHAEVDKIIKK